MGWFEFLTDAADILLSQDKTKAVERVNQRQIIRSFSKSSASRQQSSNRQSPVMRPLVSIPLGGTRASLFYMRVEELSVPQNTDLTIRVSGYIETGQLHKNEWVHFRAPQQTPITLQCISISDMSCCPYIELKASSITDIELVKQYKEKYFSCRICNPDYQD